MLTFGLTQGVYAIGVKPLRTEVTIAPGGTKSATITVINEEAKEIQARPSLDVYTKNDVDGFPVSSTTFAANDPRNIVDWVKFDAATITLQPNEERKVTLEISVPGDAEPGGRYASIVYEPITDNATSGVSIRPRVASLLLITVEGKEVRSGEVQSFGVDSKIMGDRAFSFAVDFKNTGNVHVKPQGEITIFDADKQQLTGVARYEDATTKKIITSDSIPVNILGGNVLPDSNRIFRPEWTEGVRPGSYTAKLRLTYAGGQAIEKSTPFTLDPSLKLTSFKLQDGQNSEKSFVLTLQNDGNTYERLVGTIEIVNDFDYKVGEVELPKDPDAYAAPGESKVVTVTWLKAGKKIPDGEYHAKLTATYGPTKTAINDELTFGGGGVLAFLGSAKFISAALALVTLAIAVYYFVFRKKHHHSISK